MRKIKAVFAAPFLAGALLLFTGLAGCGEASEESAAEETGLPSEVKLQNWIAILNLMPGPGPASFYVTGEVELPASNYEARLVKRVPQGINPKVLMLDLVLEPLKVPGTQALEWRLVRYEEEAARGAGAPYEQIEIFYQGNRIKRIMDIKVAQ